MYIRKALCKISVIIIYRMNSWKKISSDQIASILICLFWFVLSSTLSTISNLQTEQKIDNLCFFHILFLMYCLEKYEWSIQQFKVSWSQFICVFAVACLCFFSTIKPSFTFSTFLHLIGLLVHICVLLYAKE